MAAEKFLLFDVGASMGIHPRWKPLQERLHCFGFEPNEAEYKKLKPDPQITWVDAALAEKDAPIRLHLTKSFENSSTRFPNRRVLAELAWGDGHDIIRSLEVPGQTLDTVAKKNDAWPDFLKLDTQGTELGILQAASTQLINGLVGMELEVSFVQIYDGQALFAEVDSFLLGNGFTCWDLGNILRMKPRATAFYRTPYGRLISCDALYFRNPVPEMPTDQLAKLMVALSVYGYLDEAEDIKRRFNVPEDMCNFWALKRKHQPSSLIPWSTAHRYLSRAARLFLPRRSSSWDAGLGGWR